LCLKIIFPPILKIVLKNSFKIWRFTSLQEICLLYMYMVYKRYPFRPSSISLTHSSTLRFLLHATSSTTTTAKPIQENNPDRTFNGAAEAQPTTSGLPDRADTFVQLSTVYIIGEFIFVVYFIVKVIANKSPQFRSPQQKSRPYAQQQSTFSRSSPQ
jgi:hypothetical protein